MAIVSQVAPPFLERNTLPLDATAMTYTTDAADARMYSIDMHGNNEEELVLTRFQRMTQYVQL